LFLFEIYTILKLIQHNKRFLPAAVIRRQLIKGLSLQQTTLCWAWSLVQPIRVT